MRTRILMLVAVVVGLVTLSGAVAAQRSDPAAQALLRTATDKEIVDGDLRGAITQYQAIVNRYGRTDRATAAQALLRTAEAYRKLGDPQAKQTYQQIVTQYADQTAVVTVARLDSRLPLRQTRRPRTYERCGAAPMSTFAGASRTTAGICRAVPRRGRAISSSATWPAARRPH